MQLGPGVAGLTRSGLARSSRCHGLRFSAAPCAQCCSHGVAPAWALLEEPESCCKSQAAGWMHVFSVFKKLQVLNLLKYLSLDSSEPLCVNPQVTRALRVFPERCLFAQGPGLSS